MPNWGRIAKTLAPYALRYGGCAAAVAVGGPAAGAVFALASKVLAPGEDKEGESDDIDLLTEGGVRFGQAFAANLNGVITNLASDRMKTTPEFESELPLAFRRALGEALEAIQAQVLEKHPSKDDWFQNWRARFEQDERLGLSKLAGVDEQELLDLFGAGTDPEEALWPAVERLLLGLDAEARRRGNQITVAERPLGEEFAQSLREHLTAADALPRLLQNRLAEHETAWKRVTATRMADIHAAIRRIEGFPEAADALIVEMASLMSELRATRADIADLREDLKGFKRPQPPSGPGELGRPPGDFTGREREIDQIVAALRPDDRKAVATIWGMGGTGKTTLARAAAAKLRQEKRFPDGEIRIDLRGVGENAAAPLAALQDGLAQLGATLPQEASEAQLETLWQRQLAERRVLVLADTAASSEQVRRLSPPPPSALLVTTRSGDVHLEGNSRIRLGDWRNEPERAVEMLRKTQADETGLSEEEAAQVAKACAYLPMALRAAKVLLSTPRYRGKVDKLIEDIRAQPEKLKDHERGEDVPAALRLSVQALEREAPELAAQWRRLAVFPADFDAEAAVAVMAADREDGLWELADRWALLEYEEASGRFRLHDFYRAIAAAELQEDKADAARMAHAAHYAAVLEWCQREYDRGFDGQAAGLERFDIERTNVEAAWSWLTSRDQENNDHRRLRVRYAVGGRNVAHLRLHARERVDWFEAAAAAASKLGDQAAEARANANLGLAYGSQGDYPRAIELHEKDLALSRELGDRAGEATAYANLGVAYWSQGDYPRAIELHEKDLALSRELGDRAGEATALWNLGNSLFGSGRKREGVDLAEEGLALSEELGLNWPASYRARLEWMRKNQ